MCEASPGPVDGCGEGDSESDGHEHWDGGVEPACCEEGEDEDGEYDDLLWPRGVVDAFWFGVCGLSFEKGGFGESEGECIVGADGDAVERFDATVGDDAAIGTDFFVYSDSGGACGGAFCAAVACVDVDLDAHWCDAFDGCEESSIWASVSAESSVSEEEDGCAATDEEEGDGDEDSGKAFPEVLACEFGVPSGEGLPLSDVAEGFGLVVLEHGDDDVSAQCWPDEHVGCEDEWDESEEACSEGPGFEAEFMEEPCAGILQGAHVACPSTEPSSGEEGDEECECEEEEPWVEGTEFECFHGVGEDDASDGSATQEPVCEMCGNEQVHSDEGEEAPSLGATQSACRPLGGVTWDEDWEGDVLRGRGASIFDLSGVFFLPVAGHGSSRKVG